MYMYIDGGLIQWLLSRRALWILLQQSILVMHFDMDKLDQITWCLKTCLVVCNFLVQIHSKRVYSRIGTMAIPVSLIMVMFLHLPYVYGTYVFDKDVSQMTGVETAKNWIVLMEIQLKDCLKIRQMSHYAWTDLVGLTRCLAAVRTEPLQRCYRDKYKWKVWFHTHYHISILRRIWIPQLECRYTESLNFTAYVHGLFRINITFLHFKMSNRFGMYPPDYDCTESPSSFKIDTDRNPCEYCGSHYPWSIYFAKNRVSLKLDTHQETNISSEDIISFQVGVLGRPIVHDQCGTHTGMMTWSGFKVQWYHINVEMLCRMMIHTGFSFELKPSTIIYDGPNSNMPQLSNRKLQLNEKILSSTFQIFVVHVTKHDMVTSTLIFKAVRDKQIKLKPHQQILLRNNSGCGIKNPKTWMCTYRIISPTGTHASLKVISLDITGDFRNMYVSAGVALYNVFNQNRSLVAHWHRSIDTTNGELVITSTENELEMVVFSYSPYAVLSYQFSIQSSICIGRFIGRFIRPSLSFAPNCTRLGLWRLTKCLI